MNQSVIVSDPVIRQHPAGESKSFDPWLLWVTLRRCWYWAVPVGLVLACLAAFGVLATFEPRFRAQHLIEANEDYILYREVLKTVDDLARTEKTIFYNEIVLRPVLSDPSLRAAPSLSDPEFAERNLRDNLSIAAAGSSARMMVSYEDSNREYAAKVCNAVVDAYMNQRSVLDQKRVAILEELLDPEIDHWRTQVEEHKARVRELTMSMKGYDPSSPLGYTRNESRIALLNSYEGQINDLRVDIFELEGKLKLEEMDREKAASEKPKPVAIAAFVPPAIEVTRKVIGPADIAAFVNADLEVVKANQQVQRFESQVMKMEDLGTWRLYQSEYAEAKQNRDDWKTKLADAREAAETKAVTELEAIAEADYQHQLKQREEKIASLRASHEETQRIERQNRKKKETKESNKVIKQIQEI